MLLVILNNCTDNGVWSSIIYQIRDSNINGYEILSNIKNDVEELFDENSNNYPTLDEIYLNAEEVLRIIDSISPEDIPDYGDFILASDDDEDKNYIIRASDDEDEMSSRKSIHQFMGLIKPLCGISSDGEDWCFNALFLSIKKFCILFSSWFYLWIKFLLFNLINEFYHHTAEI